jgi:5-dehydro-2-deoxygluconokinase
MRALACCSTAVMACARSKPRLILPYWIGRPIELPQSCPIEFDVELNDVGAEIASWPLNHTVKALFLYHPDDPADLRERQERQALRLFDACPRYAS